MKVSKIRNTVGRACQALTHPVAVPALAHAAALAPARSAVPGTAGARALQMALQPARGYRTVRPDWLQFLREGERHLAAARLLDARVCLEHADFLLQREACLPGPKVAVQHALERCARSEQRGINERYDALVRMADKYEAAGHLHETLGALEVARLLKPSDALDGRIAQVSDVVCDRLDH